MCSYSMKKLTFCIFRSYCLIFMRLFATEANSVSMCYEEKPSR